jgi:hypothetical protein
MMLVLHLLKRFLRRRGMVLSRRFHGDFFTEILFTFASIV